MRTKNSGGAQLGGLALALAALNAGCTPSVSLRPRQVPPQEGAVFGVISAWNEGRDITRSCTALFSGDGSASAAPSDVPCLPGWVCTPGRQPVRAPPGSRGVSRLVSLDETGWVFTTFPIGTVSLASLSCGDLKYQPKPLVAQVRGAGRIAYFGRVQVDFEVKSPSAEQVGAVVAGRLLGGPVLEGLVRAGLPKEHPGEPALHLSNRFALDRAEYLKRFAVDADALRPELDLFAEVETIPTLPAPTSGAGFPLGGPLAAAQAACVAAASTWSAEDNGFSCSGPAMDLGMPARVKLRLCEGKVCEIVVDAGADGASFQALAPRWGALVKRLKGDLGPRLTQTTFALPDCEKGLSDCFALGRVFWSYQWRWPDRHLVSLVLDGGSAGGPPSLLVRYQAPAALDENEKAR